MSRALAHGSSNSKNQWAKTLQNYLHQSTLPLTSLVFIAIPLVLYEVGAPKVLTESHFASFLSYFGARAGFLPALAVVVVFVGLAHYAEGSVEGAVERVRGDGGRIGFADPSADRIEHAGGSIWADVDFGGSNHPQHGGRDL